MPMNYNGTIKANDDKNNKYKWQNVSSNTSSISKNNNDNTTIEYCLCFAVQTGFSKETLNMPSIISSG